MSPAKLSEEQVRATAILDENGEPKVFGKPTGRLPEIGARVVRCGACGTYMESGNRDRTFTRAVLDAHVYELLTIGILHCQHCPRPPCP